MHHVTVYSATTTTRLTFVLDWLLEERMRLTYNITDKEEEAANAPFGLAYGKKIYGVASIPDCGLMEHSPVMPLKIPVGEWGGVPLLFYKADTGCTLPFDIFSAIFYLLSRYEEYLPYTPDKHNRYPPEESILYKKGWLQRPLIDEWVAAFRLLME